MMQTLLMPRFRDKLRHHISPIHQRLEAVPEMKEYASGDASLMQYRSTVNKLSGFWSCNPPATRKLSRQFHDFRENYLKALQHDSGAEADSGRTCEHSPILRNEVALFYVLIGSSLGARQMLKQQGAERFPRQHLQVLAEQGGNLWREFLADHLIATDAAEEAEILGESWNIFESLYQRIRCAG